MFNSKICGIIHLHNFKKTQSFKPYSKDMMIVELNFKLNKVFLQNFP